MKFLPVYNWNCFLNKILRSGKNLIKNELMFCLHIFRQGKMLSTKNLSLLIILKKQCFFFRNRFSEVPFFGRENAKSFQACTGISVHNKTTLSTRKMTISNSKFHFHPSDTKVQRLILKCIRFPVIITLASWWNFVRIFERRTTYINIRVKMQRETLTFTARSNLKVRKNEVESHRVNERETTDCSECTNRKLKNNVRTMRRLFNAAHRNLCTVALDELSPWQDFYPWESIRFYYLTHIRYERIIKMKYLVRLMRFLDIVRCDYNRLTVRRHLKKLFPKAKMNKRVYNVNASYFRLRWKNLRKKRWVHLSMSNGSSPTVGSSRIRILGSWINVTAIDTRRCWPPLEELCLWRLFYEEEPRVAEVRPILPGTAGVKNCMLARILRTWISKSLTWTYLKSLMRRLAWGSCKSVSNSLIRTRILLLFMP